MSCFFGSGSGHLILSLDIIGCRRDDQDGSILMNHERKKPRTEGGRWRRAASESRVRSEIGPCQHRHKARVGLAD